MLELLHDPVLAERTTLHLGGTAIAEIRVTEAVDALKVGAACTSLGGEPFVLGAGSNLLAADGRLPVVLLRPLFTKTLFVAEEGADTVLVRVGGGVRLPRLLGSCARWGLGGLEGLCGIPGTVGGAVAMNAGSFGCETGKLLHSVRVYSPALGVVDVAAEYLNFGYRSMAIAGLNTWFFVIHATFALTRSSMNGITKAMRHNFLEKKSKQPMTAWSAGCAFKNPAPEHSAGKLLEQCGFKGKKLGGMAFSSVHANFLINEGQGSATAAFDLLECAQKTVHERLGILLERELKVLLCH
ncbi:MAG: UDP-N-acetylmuramate dehydrogenase [Desulfovibrionaceae bacterium]